MNIYVVERDHQPIPEGSVSPEVVELIAKLQAAVMALPDEDFNPQAKAYSKAYGDAICMDRQRPYNAVKVQTLYLRNNLRNVKSTADARHLCADVIKACTRALKLKK